MLAYLSAAVALSSTDNILVDPLLIAQVDEVWRVIGNDKNPVFPGWNARKTPVLIYFPGRQDLLINHPHPPEGFHRYRGPIRSAIGPIYIKNGKTLLNSDGQNTSMKVGDVETLVVADTLSTRRQWVESIASEVAAKPDEADKTIESSLFPNPYSQTLMFAHEAFHVFQFRAAPDKHPSELALGGYPSLSVENNVGEALEADALADAISRPADPVKDRRAALDWLSIREHRRKALTPAQVQYEDSAEFVEGLAKYVELRTLQALKGRAPSHDMWLLQGFTGYDNLDPIRAGMIKSMRGFMNGHNIVNGDPYGSAGIRFRQYFSGMGIAAMLDRIAPGWQPQILHRDVTLSSLVRDALKATPAELEEAWSRIAREPKVAELTAQKQDLADKGQAHIASSLAQFDESPGELVIDYSAMGTEPKLGFTPFGVLRVDDHRYILRLVPISGGVGAFQFQETLVRPVLHDTVARTLRIQLPAIPDSVKDQELRDQDWSVPGLTCHHVTGTLRREGRRVTLILATPHPFSY
ncbi:hypothetical protein [Fimbriimonas ginsengisoli]|uniref:Uncharacterized protein n=1 Tax=Fimbriimonas ginsengisoli Gsoil 348 TaxID=661478 RepID=A0A068NYZ8_FIMGI|nr:hypothetical protein [Fimbriimonas ginsengisoli]AIE87699.1 hypothetical protein OP10G_4331 [Fimbriimonas ginsengisoli Gsoil 348]